MVGRIKTVKADEVVVFKCLCEKTLCKCGYKYHFRFENKNCPACGRPGWCER